MNFIHDRLIKNFELPEEVIDDLPFLMLAGSRKLILENHRGIAAYCQQEIKIRIKKGYLIIKGTKLQIEEINQHNLKVSGLMENLYFDLRQGVSNC